MANRIRSTVVGLLVMTACGWAAQPGEELLRNGGFEQAAGPRPAAWSWQSAVRWETDGTNHWVVAEAAKPASLSIGQTVPLEEAYWKLRVCCRVRVTDVVLGAEGWHDARIAMSFHDQAGKQVGGWPNVLHFVGSTQGWETHQRDYVVPPTARELRLSCSLFSTTGKVEWDDVSVVLLKLDPVVEDAVLPPGVTARWDLESARRQETPSRGRVSINGLWRFHPVDLKQLARPAAGTGWGYAKVPGSWAPNLSRQRPIGPDFWESDVDLAKADAAWYERTITIPAEWASRRIFVNLDNPKQTARVLVDGKTTGTIAWPGGRVDISELVRPGATHTLAVLVLALPGEAESILVAAPDKIEKARAEVLYKGLAGDASIESEPAGPRLADVFIKPSVRRAELGLDCELAEVAATASYRLVAVIRRDGREVKRAEREAFAGAARVSWAIPWADALLWDIDQPNLYTLSLSLLDSAGKCLDETTPATFGFREFWIQGRDFLLNGTPVHLRCLDYSNAREFGTASCAVARETFRRARELGFNYVIHSHYDYESQSFAYLDDTLRAGDEVGFPMSYSIRHVKTIYRDFEKPDKRRDWDQVVEYEVRRVRNHPSVFTYAMNHNFTGWCDDQNPGQLDGAFEPKQEDDRELWLRRHAATLAEQFVMSLDGTRPCYHHQSGALNQMLTLNCYLCWTPLQERIEWLSRWAEAGVKPLFFVEFGLPHQASWGGHREGPFIWRNTVNSEPLATEFGAITNGDQAYALTPEEVRHLDTIERVYASGKPFHISQVLGAYWDNRWEHNFTEIKSEFTRHTWPAFRTWGISAILPWDQADLYRRTGAGSRTQVEVATDWDHLQRPGVAPDFLAWTDDWLTCPQPAGAIELTSLGRAFARVNRETLAYIAGPPARFTAQDHVFTSGETCAKQVVVINDRRRPVRAEFAWEASLGGAAPFAHGQGAGEVAPGTVLKAPIAVPMPAVTADSAGTIRLSVKVDGRSDETLTDTFAFTVLAPGRPAVNLPAAARLACFDPKGLTAAELQRLGVPCARVQSPVCPDGTTLLIVGREALSLAGPALDLAAITGKGANVLVFEQTEEVLQQRLGFRTASPGTRRVFIRQPAHPVAAGLNDELLRDWRGSSTLLDSYPARRGWQRDYPRETWCGFANSRTWQWGNYGTVASVLIEKPQRGNWSFLFDCEFDQQYSPCCEWLTPTGRVVLCQLDLSGRDRPEPVADRVLANLLAYAASPVPVSLGPATFVGAEAGRQALRELGADLSGGRVLIVGRGAAADVAKSAILEAATVVCLGLTGAELGALLGVPVTTEPTVVSHTTIGRPTDGVLVGLGNSELHWRGKLSVEVLRQVPAGFRATDPGVVAEGQLGGKRVVLVQFSPADFDYARKPYLKLSFRRANLALARMLTNCGVRLASAMADRFGRAAPVAVDLRGEWAFTTDPDATLTPEQVSNPDFDAAAWRRLRVPGTWEEQVPELAAYDGVAWYRRDFELPGAGGQPNLLLRLGSVDDEDWTYVNGKLVGHIGRDTHPDNYWSEPREYVLDPANLRPGRNVIVVRVVDLRQSGGIVRGNVGVFDRPRWLDGHYPDVPTALDDPYRYQRW